MQYGSENSCVINWATGTVGKQGMMGNRECWETGNVGKQGMLGNRECFVYFKIRVPKCHKLSNRECWPTAFPLIGMLGNRKCWATGNVGQQGMLGNRECFVYFTLPYA